MLSLKVNQKRLSHKRELALLNAAQEHGDQSARDELILSHTGFLRWMCRKYCLGKNPDDFFGDAVIGFCDAIENRDRTRAARLITYAYHCVKRNILRSDFHNHGECVGRKYTHREELRRLNVARVKLERERKQVSIETLSAQTHFSFSKVANLLHFERGVQMSVSLDADVYCEDDSTFHEVIADERAAQAYEKINIKVDVDYFLSHLSACERYVVERRYGIPIKQTYVQIGKNLGLSQSSVSLMFSGAMEKLQRLASALQGTPEQIQDAIHAPKMVMSGGC